jgi:putative endonuclease
MVPRDRFIVLIAVSIMANRRHGTLYSGVTSTLAERVNEHREGLIPGFTKTFGLKRLVWYEPHETIVGAIQRETTIKKYKREWKINLIERANPYWDDLSPGLFGFPNSSSPSNLSPQQMQFSFSSSPGLSRRPMSTAGSPLSFEPRSWMAGTGPAMTAFGSG